MIDRSTDAHRVRLAGFGRATPSVAEVVDVDPQHAADAVKDLPVRGGIARGLGRSYGDAAQRAGGAVLRLPSSTASVTVDRPAGTVTAGAGVSLDDLLRVLVPAGFFVPVTPGTRYVTVGGAVASDIHGKNHHAEGTFGRHVRRLTLLLADTTVVEVGPDRDPDLFWATVGGMGLTGLILDATFDLIPIRTSSMTVDTRRLPDLDAVMAAMSDTDDDTRYSVAWLDLLATGPRLGRGVLTNAEHAALDELPADQRSRPLAFDPGQLVAVPPVVPPPGLINRLSVAAFNEVWFRRAPVRRDGELQSIGAYFHPLDLVGDWNRVYGSRGFVQYQFVVPFGAEGTVRTVVERLSAGRVPIFLSVLKRFGEANPAPLSFPTAGWTLAVDIGASVSDLSGLLHGLDELVLAAGGRHYLAKDFHTTPDVIRRGYPRLDEWLAVRRRVDPTGVFMSDLAARLGLGGT